MRVGRLMMLLSNIAALVVLGGLWPNPLAIFGMVSNGACAIYMAHLLVKD